jgi:gluconolactonase
VISPEGKVIERYPMPDIFPTNIAFGGPDLRTAYVTLSSAGKLVSFQWPRPGLPLHWLNKRAGQG